MITGFVYPLRAILWRSMGATPIPFVAGLKVNSVRIGGHGSLTVPIINTAGLGSSGDEGWTGRLPEASPNIIDHVHKTGSLESR